MANNFCFLMPVSFLVTTLVIPSSSTIDSSSCQGSMAECMENDEFDMDTDINRRVLQTTRYISYGALQRNTVPCSKRGASYNCQAGAQANLYSRGCSAITRCRS